MARVVLYSNDSVDKYVLVNFSEDGKIEWFLEGANPAEMQQQIDNMLQTISQMTTKDNTHDDEIEALQQAVTTIQNNWGTMVSNVESIGNEVEDMEQGMTTMTTNLNTANGKITALQGRQPIPFQFTGAGVLNLGATLGLTCVKSATGTYTLTHNLGHTNYVVGITPDASLLPITSAIQRFANYCTIKTFSLAGLAGDSTVMGAIHVLPPA